MPGQSGRDEDVATVPELRQYQVDSVEVHGDVADLRLSDSESLENVRVELLWRQINWRIRTTVNMAYRMSDIKSLGMFAHHSILK